MPARLRAPQEHGGVLAVPPLGEAGKLLEINRARLQNSSPIILGRPLAQLRTLAQQEARAAAISHLQSVGVTAPHSGDSGWIVTGHQPELFHPGVWVKNFAAYGLARRYGLTPLHVIIDNDAVKKTSIRVPELSAKLLRQVAVPFDAWSEPKPYEDYLVQDESVFAHFPEAVRERLQGAGYEASLPKLWNHALTLAPRIPLLGLRISGARRRLEADWDCHNLEVPLSRLCQTEAFGWFASHLLAELPRFHRIHNECLLAFRRERRIRSRNHPVPELARDGDWLEAPLWGWRAGERQRQRLFIRSDSTALRLRLGEVRLAELPQHDPRALVAEFRHIEENGVKLRPRALSTTLFLRLFLADLFIHGIGGAIYDELTDRIIQNFYGMKAPEFLTLSATLHLPLPFRHSASRLLPRIRRYLRDTEWNPERYVAKGSAVARSLAEEKQHLIKLAPVEPADKLTRFRALRHITNELRPHATRARRGLKRTEAFLTRMAESERLAHDREYAFCLYPEVELRQFMARFTA